MRAPIRNPIAEQPPIQRRFRLAGWALCGAFGVLMAVSGCGAGSLATPDTDAPTSPGSSSAAPSMLGPTIVVTVPDLVTTESPSPPAASGGAAGEETSTIGAVSSAPPTAVAQNPPSSAGEPAGQTAAPQEPPAPVSTPQPAPPAPAPQAAASTAPTTAAPARSGDGLNVSLANCDGCTVLATHRNVTGKLSAALVGTGSRAILLSVAADGAAAGIIGIPYGAAFPEPDGGVLACAQSRCVVEGRQPDGRAILSAFELTDSGAWRDVSGDDAFPSATEQAAVVDVDGSLAIAVQDQGDAGAVWLLYTWNGDRYVVSGCSADGPMPTSVDAVSPDQCLS